MTEVVENIINSRYSFFLKKTKGMRKRLIEEALALKRMK